MAENVISNKFHYFFNHKIPGFIQWISNDIFTACYFLTVKFYVFDAEYGIYEGCPKIPWTGSITFNVFSFLHNVSYTILYQNFIFTHETGLKKNVVAPEYTRKQDFYIMIMCMYDYQLLSEIQTKCA